MSMTTPAPDKTLEELAKGCADLMNARGATTWPPILDALQSATADLSRQLEEARKALNICWADAHLIKLEWCESQSETLANVIKNIRKHGAYFQVIEKSLQPKAAQ